MEKARDILSKTIAGIDYGNRYAGTTVLCYNSAHKVRFLESHKNSDADTFLLAELAFIRPDIIMIDAPLSLPGVYWLDTGYNDHFFRKCDREMKAMSPMFLGGLTARAMGLKKRMNGMGKNLFETYPRKLVQILNLPESQYKKKNASMGDFVDHLIESFGVRINKDQVSSWHHIDALLAFYSGIRHLEKKSLVFGVWDEGEVFV
jgi:predicted nuclease with RNAse H fold